MWFCTPAEDDGDLLYHYTSEDRMVGILACQCIWASSGEKNAKFGPGAYFTDLAPETVTGTTPYQLSRALYEIPWNFRRVTNYVAVDPEEMSNRPRWVHSLWSSTYSGGIYLASSTGPVSVAGAVRGSGRVSF
jgi:hypothetical protein